MNRKFMAVFLSASLVLTAAPVIPGLEVSADAEELSLGSQTGGGYLDLAGSSRGADSVTTYTLDEQYDCNAFWETKTEGFEVTTGAGIEISFKNRTKPTEDGNHCTPYIIAFAGSENKVNGAGYDEYAVIRSDAYAWTTKALDANTGDGLTAWENAGYKLNATFDTNFVDWATWLAANKSDEGVNCKVSAFKDDEKVTITVVNHTVTSVTEIPYTGDDKFYISIGGQTCVFGNTLPSVDTPDDPDTPDNPDTSATPDNPDTSATPDNPSDADTSVNAFKGPYDCDGFWTTFTDGMEVTTDGIEVAFKSRTKLAGNANWTTPYVVAYTGNENKVNCSGYTEYAVIRSDNYAWGNKGHVLTGVSVPANDAEWAEWLAANKSDSGVDCKVSAIKGDGKITITFVNHTVTSVTEIPYTGNDKFYISISGEQCVFGKTLPSPEKAKPLASYPIVVATPTPAPTLPPADENSEGIELECGTFLSAQTSGLEVTESGTALTFKNTTNSSASNNWETPIVIVYTGSEPVFQGAGYKEYVVIRSDNWAWGPAGVGDKTAATWASSGYNMTDNLGGSFDWAAWLSSNKSGTDCKVQAIKTGGKVYVEFTNGTITSVTSFPVADGEKIYVSLSGEQCKLTNIKPANYTGINGINAEPSASAEPGASTEPTTVPTTEPGTTPAPGNTSEPSNPADPGTSNTPAEPGNTVTPADPSEPTDEPSEPEEKKTMKISTVTAKTGAKKVTGTISVKSATVKVKVGSKKYKNATVNGKKFTFKTSSKLKKGTKVTIKATKSGYKAVTKTVKVK